MSHPTVIFWPDANSNKAAIAPLQEVGTDLTVRITSDYPNMPNVPVNNSGIYFYNSMIRTVSLTSAANLSGINFSITGLSSPIDVNGNPTLSVVEPFTEIIAGPNANTVYTTRIYQRIDSIITSAPTTPDTVSVGFGTRGITAYIFVNLNSHSPLWIGYQGYPVGATLNFDYNLYASMTKPEIINDQYGNVSPFPHQIPATDIGGTQHNNIFVTNGVNGSAIVPSIVWATINDREAPPAASFYFTVTQQGIT